MRSFLSCFFLSPANTILVPGIIFFGFVKYLFSVFLSHVSPELRFADEYENPPILPASRPTIPHKLGPCPLAPPFSVLWHCAHLAWKILAPFSADMMDLCVWFVMKQMDWDFGLDSGLGSSTFRCSLDDALKFRN